MGRLDEAPEGAAIEAVSDGAETAARHTGSSRRRAAKASVAAGRTASMPPPTAVATGGSAVQPMPATPSRARRPTSTSAFGVSRRESHDSSAYYESALYRSLPQEHDTGTVEHIRPEDLDVVLTADSRDLRGIPDNSVHLMVTSPPYNVGKAYDDGMDLREYLQLLRDVFSETWRVLVPGGRAVINVANLGRKPYIPLSSHLNLIMHELGFLMRGEIIWDKSASAGSSCAWGSFQSASNPCLRDVHEYLLVFSKGQYKLERTKQEKADDSRPDSISKEDFIEHTKSIWRFHAESAKRVNHAAPYPVELPRRVIEMYSFAGDIVLDPFLGSGSTAIAAMRTDRRFIGVDISEDYTKRAQKRIERERAKPGST